MKMRVLHVTLSFARGGRRTAIQSLIEGLRGLGAESDLCCLDDLGCPPEEVNFSGFRVEVLSRRSLFDWAALGRFRRLCREARYNLIHTHDAASQFTAALTRFGGPPVPVVMTFHRSISMESANAGDRLRNALASWRCGAIITGSLERRDHFLSQNLVSPRKLVHIPFGTDLSRFYPDSASREAVREELGFGPDVTLFGAIGHFGPEKGVDIAIREFQTLRPESLASPVALVVFGEGPRREELERMAQYSAGNTRRTVRFVGFRKDIHRCLRGLDVLLHAPRQEAFGLVVIEAMATGIPVVASQVGGIPELVRDGSTGFLAQPEKAESFAQGLERLVNDRVLRIGMGQEARRVALAEYGRDLFARRHLELYESLIAGRSPIVQNQRASVATSANSQEKLNWIVHNSSISDRNAAVRHVVKEDIRP